MEGLINPTGPFSVPIISVTNGWGTQLGVSKANENYIQYHYVVEGLVYAIFTDLIRFKWDIRGFGAIAILYSGRGIRGRHFLFNRSQIFSMTTCIRRPESHMTC